MSIYAIFKFSLNLCPLESSQYSFRNLINHCWIKYFQEAKIFNIPTRTFLSLRNVHRKQHYVCGMALMHTPNFPVTLPLHFNIPFERQTVGHELKCKLKCDKLFHLLTIYSLVPNGFLYPFYSKNTHLSFSIFCEYILTKYLWLPI